MFAKEKPTQADKSNLPGKNGSQVSHDPLGGVLAEDGDRVVTLEPEVDEAAGHELNLGIVLFVRPGL